MASIERREGSNGKIHYRAKVRLKGFPPQSATFKRRTDAKNWVQDTESAIRNRRHFKTSEAKKRTLAELLDKYEAQVLPEKRSQRTQKQMLNWWRKELGHCTLANVTPAIIADHRDALLNGKTHRDTNRAPSTVVRYLALLSHAFSMAVKEWGWIETNPVLKVSKPKEPRARIRFLSKPERQALLASAEGSTNEYLYPVVILALTTGMRRGEIMALTWPDVSFADNSIIIHETKNNERRRVPLIEPAKSRLKTLSRVRRLDTQLLFPSRANPHKPIDLKRPWENAVKASGIEGFRFHDLRHTAASYLAMTGASPLEIAEVLGHKTLQMVKRYAHLSNSHTEQVMNAMSEKFLNDA